MIDRYAIFSKFDKINGRYGLSGEEFIVPNYNASPSQQLPVITNMARKQISFYFWGVNQEWSNNKTISPKLLSVDRDKLSSKAIFKSALEKRRCIVPVNGFYLWKQYSKKRKTPHYIFNPSETMFSISGIWEENEDMDGNVHFTFMLIEIPNYLGVPEFGSMMPSIIPKKMETKWLDNYSTEDELKAILHDVEFLRQMNHHPVSPHIAVVSNNNEELIKPQSPADQLGNYTLFD